MVDRPAPFQALTINQQLLGGLAAVMTLRHVFNVSPLFVLLCLGLFLCFASGGRGPPGREEARAAPRRTASASRTSRTAGFAPSASTECPRPPPAARTGHPAALPH